MPETLTTELCRYLGQLLHEQQTALDWAIKCDLDAKIHAVKFLLGLL